jgi:hypothetical protein
MADIYELARIRLAARGVTAVYGGGFCTVSDQRFFLSPYPAGWAVCLAGHPRCLTASCLAREALIQQVDLVNPATLESSRISLIYWSSQAGSS